MYIRSIYILVNAGKSAFRPKLSGSRAGVAGRVELVLAKGEHDAYYFHFYGKPEINVNSGPFVVYEVVPGEHTVVAAIG